MNFPQKSFLAICKFVLVERKICFKKIYIKSSVTKIKNSDFDSVYVKRGYEFVSYSIEQFFIIGVGPNGGVGIA